MRDGLLMILANFRLTNYSKTPPITTLPTLSYPFRKELSKEYTPLRVKLIVTEGRYRCAETLRRVGNSQ